MQHLISFLQGRLQEELPHRDIRREGLPQKLLNMLIEAEKVQDERFARNPPRVCAVMIALYAKDSEVYLPMMLRPDNIRAHPGQISFPGGKQEPEDEDLAATAIRETMEEVGVLVPRGQILGQLSPVYIPPSNSLVTPIVGYLDQPPSYDPDEREVAEVFDVALSVLRNPDNRASKKVVLADGEWISMPAYLSEERLIWGGTARMISELVKVLESY